MSARYVLDLGGDDVFPAPADDVLLPAVEVVEEALVPPDQISGMEPAATHDIRGLWTVQITGVQPRPSHQKFSPSPSGASLSLSSARDMGSLY